MRLACRLRRLREQDGVSLKQMARLTGIDRGYLSRYETGKEIPRDHHIATLEKHYGAPARTWFHPHVLIELTRDDGSPL